MKATECFCFSISATDEIRLHDIETIAWIFWPPQIGALLGNPTEHWRLVSLTNCLENFDH